jgi:hypothetical protein
MKITFLLSMLIMILASSPALAERGHQQGPMFKKADTNADGKVSKEEYLKAQEQQFAKMDANSDGFFTQDEAEALKQKWAEKRKERMERKQAAEGQKPEEAPAQ